MQAGRGTFRILIAIEALMLVPGLAGSAQRAGPFTAGFDFECAETQSLPVSIQGFLEDRIQRQGRLGAANWLDRAIRTDLNGDGAGEYLVPYDCGTTGNCIWALFDGHSLQHLGDLEAASIYPTPPRRKGWPPLEVFLRSGMTEGWVATYACHRGTYSRGSWSRLTDPTGTGQIHHYLSSRPAIECAGSHPGP